eukprot:1531192-Prymnesium_polylepis.1
MQCTRYGLRAPSSASTCRVFPTEGVRGLPGGQHACTPAETASRANGPRPCFCLEWRRLRRRLRSRPQPQWPRAQQRPRAQPRAGAGAGR